MLPLVVLVFLSAASLQPVQSANDFTCSESVCTAQLATKPCGSLPYGCTKTDEVTSGFYFSSPSACNCCEYCVSWLTKGAGCVVNATTTSTPTSMCGPGLSCSPVSKTCLSLNTPCTLQQQAYDNDLTSGTLGSARWRPTCDDNGDYSYVKCIPNSICYCVEPQTGARIFGEKVYTDSYTPSSMNCGCSLAAWRSSQLESDAELIHCLSDGSFDPLQCVGTNCTCVNPIDGAAVSNKTVPVNKLKDGALPCFDSSQHSTGKYLRSCEERRLQFRRLTETTEYTVINAHLPNCSADGRFAPLQDEGVIKRCVDPEGNTIEDFQWSGEISDCECARTRWLLKEAGVPEMPGCEANGSYRPWQCWRGQCHCVDCVGNQLGADVPRAKLNQLLCYKAKQCASDYSTLH